MVGEGVGEVGGDVALPPLLLRLSRFLSDCEVEEVVVIVADKLDEDEETSSLRRESRRMMGVTSCSTEGREGDM